MAEREKDSGKVYRPAPVERKPSRFDKRPRSPSPATSRSHPGTGQAAPREPPKNAQRKRADQRRPKINPSIDIATVDPDDPAAIAQVMGFDGFDSTKGKHVPGNHNGYAHIRKQREYRQFMHVKGLYDRPLVRQDQEKAAGPPQ